jgi:hypothetical protein
MGRTGSPGSPGRVPLEALILAFAHSRAKALVGTDALRSVLSGQYRELHHDGIFDLEPVWQLLAQQPGFDPEQVRPPLCRFKTWEAQLAVTVRLPADMASLGLNEVTDLAAQIHVPARERARVLEGGRVSSGDPEIDAFEEDTEPTPRPAARTDPAIPMPQTTRTPRLRRLSRGQRRGIVGAALVLALVGFSAAGIQLQRSCTGRSWDEVSTRFTADIPLAAAARQGPEVSGDLRDGRWLALPASVRTAHMKAALEALPRDVQVFFVRDHDGHIRAVARWFGQPRQIAVSFP